MSEDEIKRNVESIYNEMEKAGYNFNQDMSTVKKEVREKFTAKYPSGVSRPKLINVIASILNEKIGDKQDEELEEAPKPTPSRGKSGSTAASTSAASAAGSTSAASSSTTPLIGRRKKPTIEDVTKNILERDMNIKSNSSKAKAYVEFTKSTLNGINIKVGNNPYESPSEIKPSSDFEKDFDNLEDAESSLLSSIVGSTEANKYYEAVNTYSVAVEALRKKYPVVDKKKVQKFTYVKKDFKVKFVNPADNNKLGYLSVEEAAPFVIFNNSMTAFEKVWKENISATKFKPLEYLSLPVIRTQNIIKFELVRDSFPNVAPESTSKLTNMVLSETNMSEAELGKIPTGKFAPDYMQLFVDLKKFNGSQFPHLIKNIYTHRSGIVLHPACSSKFKKECWLQAYANIKAIDDKSIETEQERLVIKAWQNVLSSRFAYHIIMDCVPESSLFNKAMVELIQEGTSIKLFESVLYPISFAFTPFMLGYDNLALPKQALTNMSETTYKKELARIFFDFGSSSLKLYEYDPCLWLYYSKDKDRNVMVDLLHNVVLTTDTKKVEKKKGGRKAANTTEVSGEQTDAEGDGEAEEDDE